MADIGEKIFEAFDIIIQERLSGLQFDKTITGVIESIEGIAEEGKENKYIVNDGSTKYTVYSNNVYKVDTSVYVSIPNGDYTQKKFIVGYNLGQDDVKSSTLATDTFVDLTGAVWESVNETTLLANNPAILSKDIIWTTAPSIGTGDSIDYNKAPMGYSRMRLSAEISTLFGTKPIRGRYGIRGAVSGLDPKGIVITSPVEFSTKDWFGDYYNFDGWWPQEIIFDLKDKINTILDIRLSFYQIYDNENNKEEFVSASEKRLAYSADGELFDDNLKVRNIQVSFGYDENELSGKNSLMVYAKQDEISRGQVYFSDTDGFRSPVAKARLVHFNEELQAFKEYNTWDEAKTLFETIEAKPLGITYPKIEWYVNRASAIGKDIKDILTSPNLEKINKTIVEGEETKDIYAFEIALSEAIEQTKTAHDFKAALQYLDMEKLKESFPEGFSEEDLQNYFNGNLTDENKEAIAKALITQNSITVQSDFIKYTDEAVKDAAAIVDKATAVYLVHVGDKDQYKGRYNIYHNGVLKNDADGSIPRVVTPMFKNNKYKLTEGSKIIWKVPVGDDTMIDSSDYTQASVDGYKIIEKTVENKKDKDGNKLNEIDNESYQLVYRISKLYSSMKDTRNIIKCQVKLNEETIFDEVSQEIFFGTTGAVGTNYGIEIKLEREYDSNFNPIGDVLYAIPQTLKKGNSVKVKAELHHMIKKISSQPEFTWAWVDSSTHLDIKDGPVASSKEKYIFWKDEDNKISTNSVLEVSCTVGGLKVKEYFPIPSKNDGVSYLNGSDKIVYNSNGSLKQYYADSYELIYDKSVNEGQLVYRINGVDEETKNPELKITNKNNIVPVGMYYQGIKNIQCLTVGIGSAILWSQPIYVYQDKWPSEVLNQWDGSLTINENNGTILSAMMAAGSKDKNNTFTGVVMGKVELDDGNHDGLFGFSKGQETFGFKSNGTAFIGGSGAGQIKFEGDSGTIKSGNYSENESGMLIDLTNGAILTPNFKLTQDGTKSQKGNIAGWDFNDMSLIAPNKSIALYSDTQLTETEIAGFSSKEWRLTIGDNFGVTSAGVMYASIPGQATEVSGSIVEQLNTLASDHQTIEDDIDGIEDRLEELEKNISPVTPGGNNRYLNQRVSDLEKFVGEKDEADKNEKTLYQRVVDLENTVADIKAWKESYKAESIAWITGFTPETETITVPDGDGTKEITIITGITPITTDITVLMEK